LQSQFQNTIESEPVKEEEQPSVPTPPASVSSKPASARASQSPTPIRSGSKASTPSKEAAALNSDGEPIPGEEGAEGEEVKPKKKLRLRETLFLPKKPNLNTEPEVDAKKQLSFIVQMKDATVVEGVPVKILCSVDGPRPDIKWFKNNIPCVYNKQCKNQTTQTMGAVYFPKISPDDAGVYSCIVKNNYCEISTKGTITVIPTPKPKHYPPSFSKSAKGMFHFRLKFTGYD
jgi:Immunoglobulin I-set domain